MDDFTGDAALYLDIYGGLLTKKQAEILDFYYNEDYTLSEIASGLKISKQAAHDAVKSGTASLLNYESELGLVRNYKASTDIGTELSEVRSALAIIKKIALGSKNTELNIQLDRIETAAGRVEKIIDRIY